MTRVTDMHFIAIATLCVVLIKQAWSVSHHNMYGSKKVVVLHVTLPLRGSSQSEKGLD